MSLKNDFFSNTNPDLVSLKSLNELNDNVLVNDTVKKMSNLGESSINFYKKYIQPNLIPIIVLVIFIIFIIYRYMSKNQEKDKEKFDPSKPIDDPKQTKLELHEIGRHHELDNIINNIVEKNEIDEILNDDMIYEDLYKPENSDREEYRGAINKFKNDKTIKMDHPYGYDNDFIEMENTMLEFTTKQNKSKIDEATSLLFS